MSVYLDNAATSHPKPEEVYVAVDTTLRRGGSANRATHPAGMDATRELFRIRETVAGFFGVRDSARLVFGNSATDAINLGLKSWLRPGDHVVTTSVEHNAVVRCLQALRARGVAVTVVPSDSVGRVNPNALLQAVTAATRLVVCTHASNVLASVNPIADLGAALTRRGVPLFVDASQTAGWADLDVEQMGISMLAAPGHKGLLGPQGTGILYVREDLALGTWREGGTGTESVSAEMPLALPERLEPGTHNLAGLAGLEAGIRWIQGLGLANLRARKLALVDALLDKLGSIPALRVVSATTRSSMCPLITFALEGVDSGWLCGALAEAGFAVRGGLHCAPGAHEAAGTMPWGAVRVSPGIFTTVQDMQNFGTALENILKEKPT